MTASAAARTNPFVGLRPFEAADSHLFFGRDRQVNELLTRLRTERFVAVLGASGSGKSSLIRAGLLPALEGGLLASVGASWRIAILRPGGDPIRNLAAALDQAGVWPSHGGAATARRLDILEAVLRRGSLGLVEVVGEADLPRGDAVLVVVDQFEELFRFKRAAAEAREDAAAFVKLLLHAIGHTEPAIHVVLTMRSEFLGNCSEFHNLPEAINDGLFLIPRLNRDQLMEAIVGPVAVARSHIMPSLVQRLLNDVGDDPDQLPVLQHVLMRMWARGRDPLTLDDYDAVKGMQAALSEHADEAYGELDPDHQKIAEHTFRCLTERGPDGREVRRPTSLADLAGTTGASAADVIQVADRFRQEGRSFLTPPMTEALVLGTIIDISHESLIRKWKRLRDWVNQEAEDRRIYMRVAESAAGHAAGEEPLWKEPRLTWADQWRTRFRPTEGWARRYAPGLDRVLAFLDRSLAARRSQRNRRLAMTYGAIAGVVLLVAAGLRWQEAQHHQAEQAELERLRESEDAATKAKKQAETNLENEYKLRQRAETEADLLRQLETVEGQRQEESRVLQSVVMGIADRAARATPTGGEVAALVALQSLRRAQQTGASKAAEEAQQVLANNLRLFPLTRWWLRSPSPILNFVVTPAGKLLAIDSASSAMAMWDVTSVPPKALAVSEIEDEAKLIAPAGRRVFWISGTTLHMWNSDAGGTETKSDPSFAQASLIAVSSAGEVVALGGGDGVRLWPGAGRPAELDKERLTALAVSADGKMVAGAKQGVLRVWSADTGARLGGDLPIDEKVAVQQLLFSPKGRYIAVGAGNSVHLWKVQSDAPVRIPRTPATNVNLQRVTDLAFSPDEQYLATASDDQTSAILRISEEPTLSARVVARVRHAGSVRRVAFGRDNILATAGGDNTARVWRTDDETRDNSWMEIYRVPHRAAVRALVFLQNGDLVTGDTTGRVLAVRIAGGRAAERPTDTDACLRLSRNLTLEEWKTYYPAQSYELMCPGLDPSEILERIFAHAQARETSPANEWQRQLRNYPNLSVFNPRNLVTAASAQAAAGSRNEAAELLRLAVKATAQQTSSDSRAKASLSNHVCWEGITRDFADDVWSACVDAVKLDPSAFGHVDSRGVAYALRGDTKNALADFRHYVEQGRAVRSADRIKRRDDWIRQLEAGQNPFDSKGRKGVLEDLRKESGALVTIDR